MTPGRIRFLSISSRVSFASTANLKNAMKVLALLVLALACLPCFVLGQTANTGTVVGTVTDATGAVVAGAQVELRNTATDETHTQATNSAGQYVFPGVRPGNYRVTVTMQGFRTAAVSNLKVEVAKSHTVDVVLEVGTLAQTVEVSATARTELQTTDSTVGNVITMTQLPRFPALTRQVNELLTLQPGATPTGEVTGARSDQSTFSLDGVDVTNNSVGGLITFIFLPIDSVEEFRVGVANPNATFGRGAGGQVALDDRGGTNQYHGAAYWYHQNDDLNANSWDNNRLKLPRPELKDNRFGGRVGGPLPFLWSKKTFFFVNYEGRRFPSATPQSRIVPTDTLKQGILQFRDAGGTVRSYNLATSTACGAGACDPRGLGISPSMAALWKLLPAGNDPGVSGADGLNTTGFTTNVGTPLRNNFYDIRLDQNISSKWHALVT
jgi:carboxypeptidase family protein